MRRICNCSSTPMIRQRRCGCCRAHLYRSPTSRRPDSLTREHRRRATPERRMAHSDFLVSSQGVRSPRILYGTAWKKMRTQELVRLAIERGFRGIDTACQPKHYQEAAVGAGVAACLNDKLRRSD